MIYHFPLLPVYVAAGTAVLAFLADLVLPGRRWPALTMTALGAAGTIVASVIVGRGPDQASFCVPLRGCLYEWTDTATLIGVTVAGATLMVAMLCGPELRARELPAGELGFLLACSMTGGVVLGASQDLITLIIALETLTLPLYALVALRRGSVRSAEAGVTFFTVSVVSTAVTLLGAALLYASTGTVILNDMSSALVGRAGLPSVPLVSVAVVLVLVGLAFKVAAVPFHAWAPATYDGAPLPVAAYLSTASKLGGVIALLYVAVRAGGPLLDVAGPALAAIAVATMTVGNLVALRQRRMVRLLAWSSVAQAGYILAPLGALALADGRTMAAMRVAVTAVLAYAVFYVILELAAFGAVIALRGADDGGELGDYRGAGRRRPWVSIAFVVALAGLAGLPPGLAGLFAKVTVVKALLEGSAGWLAIVVAINAVIGLAYYVRAAAGLYQPDVEGAGDRWPRLHWAVALALLAVTVAGVVVGFAPQLVLDAAGAL